MSQSDCSYIAYIDESGELGTNYERGSSEFLVMGAAILPSWLPDIPSEFFEHARQVDRHKVSPIPKFQKCKEKRQWLLTHFFRLYPIHTIHVAVHKPTLFGSHIGRNLNDCYAYLIKLTLERVSWWVRDQHHINDPGNARCRLVFSENEALPYSAIREYLSKLRGRRGMYNCRIEWPYTNGRPL
jgi:Protein of unknown function (DUF3800)